MKRDETFAGAPVRNRGGAGKKLPSASLTLALEPRFMYDAAGGATAAAVAKAAEPPPAPPPADHAEHVADTAPEAAVQGATEQGAPANGAAPTPGDGSKHTDVPADVGPFGSKGEAQLEKASAGANAPIREIVFVDGRLPDLGAFKAEPGVEVVVLDPAKDGLKQVSDVLATHKGDLTAIHFVGHGENGAFGIGSTTVDAATLSAKAGEISQWGSALTANGDIMIWGCDVAQLPGGQALINSLSSLTGADVAASTDETGASVRGGDWTLEAKTGSIETALPFEMAAVAAWDHLLVPPTITGNDEVLRVAEQSAINEPGTKTEVLLSDADISINSSTGQVSSVVVTLGLDSQGRTIGFLQHGSETGTSLTFDGGTIAEFNSWLAGLKFVSSSSFEPGSAGSSCNAQDRVSPGA